MFIHEWLPGAVQTMKALSDCLILIPSITIGAQTYNKYDRKPHGKTNIKIFIKVKHNTNDKILRKYFNIVIISFK